MTAATLHAHTVRPDGDSDTFWSLSVPCRRAPMAHHKAGLQWTATGYGSRIPTEWQVQLHGRWRRVYLRIFSNAGTAYIGTLREHGERVYVRDLPY